MPRPAATPGDRPTGRPHQGPGRPGLRGLPCVDLDRLPLAVPAVPSEHPASWLARAAYRYGLTPSGLLAAVGLRPPSWSPRKVQAYLARHADVVERRLGYSPGLPTAHGDRPAEPTAVPPNHSAGLAAADGDADEAVGGRHLQAVLTGYQEIYRGSSGGWRAGSRFCPSCLAASSGVWPASWTSPLHLVCLTHQQLLITDCPGCGRVPWSSPAWAGRPLPAWTCTEPSPAPSRRRRPDTPAGGTARRGWCGQDLRESPPAPASEVDLQVQRRLVAAARAAATDPLVVVTVCGQPSCHLEVVEAVLELLDESQHGRADTWRVSGDPRPVLDGLAVAFAVLDQPDAPSAAAQAGRSGVLNPKGRHTPLGPDLVLGRRQHNGLLAAIRLSCPDRELPASLQLTFRLGSARPRYPEPGVRCDRVGAAGRDGQVPLRAIPQLLWPGPLSDHLALPDVRVAVSEGGAAAGAGRAVALVAGRACAAMFLARLASTRSWHLIALELGLPAWFAGQPAALHRRLVEAGRWPVFLADLDALADHLQAAPPPIDYRTRRWLCTDPPRLLAAVRAARVLTDDVLPAGLSDQTLARMFWQVYTGGDLHLAPAPFGHPEPWQPGYDVKTAASDEDLDVSRRVLRIVQAVLEHDQVSTGPLLTWTPAACGRATPVGDQDHDQEDETEDEVVRRGWALPDVVAARGDYADDVALDAALAAAEEHFTERAFDDWLWRWLDLNYGIPRSDDNARQYHHRVWSLRQALAHPQIHPQPVGHPAVDRALAHTNRRGDGHLEPWRLPL